LEIPIYWQINRLAADRLIELTRARDDGQLIYRVETMRQGSGFSRLIFVAERNAGLRGASSTSHCSLSVGAMIASTDTFRRLARAFPRLGSKELSVRAAAIVYLQRREVDLGGGSGDQGPTGPGPVQDVIFGSTIRIRADGESAGAPLASRFRGSQIHAPIR
jgi:xanthine dehydrogenase iron-sulfur cluster and FAD-binding subunit A